MRSLRVQVTSSLGCPPELFPYLDELFGATPNLGSSPRRLATLLRDHGLSHRHHVIDLGCGRGGVAVELARRTGCRVLGLDACAKFIDAARELASLHGVGRRCRFIQGDFRHLPTMDHAKFDAALMIGCDPFDAAASLLRTLARPGGLYLMDDALRVEKTPGSDARRRGEHARRLRGATSNRHADEAPSRAEAIHFIEDLGDRVLSARLVPARDLARMHESLYRGLARRAEDLRRDHPHLRPLLLAFLKRQREAQRVLAGPVRPVVILARRSAARPPQRLPRVGFR